MCNRWHGSSKCGPVSEAPGLIEDFVQALPFLRSKTITCLSMMPSSEFGNTCGRNAGHPQIHSRSCSYTRARMSDPLLRLSGTLKQREWDVLACARKAKEEEELRVFEEKDCNVVNVGVPQALLTEIHSLNNSDYIIELLKIDWKHGWRTYGIWILVLFYQQINERMKDRYINIFHHIYLHYLALYFGILFAEIVVCAHF